MNRASYLGWAQYNRTPIVGFTTDEYPFSKKILMSIRVQPSSTAAFPPLCRCERHRMLRGPLFPSQVNSQFV
jgi:hypothetical protein